MKLLVTGCAGFIGLHVTNRLLEDGHEVTGVDNLSDYYDIGLKRARLDILSNYPNFVFFEMDISDETAVENLFVVGRFQRVIHLAAQPGVRYSLDNPREYMTSNLVGFLNILEGCRHGNIEHLLFASSSSVYGSNEHLPFHESDSTDHPISLYGATKKSNEVMAHSYSHLFNISVTGLRFFTVYGPWGRPDMAPSIFATKICKSQPIDVFNYGKMKRDFTYIDDIVEAVVRTLDRLATPDTEFDRNHPVPMISDAPFRLYNVGSGEPIELMLFIRLLESALEREAVLELRPLQAGDPITTWSDITLLDEAIRVSPRTPITEGIPIFAEWFKSYYGH
jgi:UDP-glucuronate 4-epimerase